MRVTTNKSGIILVSVIGVIAVLTIIASSAYGLSATVSQRLSRAIARTKAQAAALAGINYAVSALGQHPARVDSWWLCGIDAAGDKERDTLLHHVVLSKESSFDIEIVDGTRKLNVNAINEANVDLFSRLVQAHGFPKDAADQAAAGLLEWLTKTKKAPLDDLGELILVPGFTAAMYVGMKDDLTIYPKEAGAGVKVNYWTVSQTLLDVLIAQLREHRSVENLEEIISLAAKYRVTDKPITPDPIETAKMGPAGHASLADAYVLKVTGHEDVLHFEVAFEAVVTKDPSGKWSVQRIDQS